MIYSEESWIGPDIFGNVNPSPQHAQHCADRLEHLRLKRASFSDLHHRLGKFIEDRPGEVQRPHGNGRPIDTDKRYFEGLEIDAATRSTPAIDELLADARAADPGFDARCQTEWDAIDTDALIKAQVAKRNCKRGMELERERNTDSEGAAHG